MDSELEDLIRACNEWIEHLSDQEDENIVCLLVFASNATVRPYGDSDDLAASLAFSKLSSID